MQKTILLTGATDGIGLATATQLVSQGHKVLLHGRNGDKLGQVKNRLAASAAPDRVESYLGDLSRMSDVAALAQAVASTHDRLDVLINNAGIFHTSNTRTTDGLDVRFAVNTIAPFLLTTALLPLLGMTARVINLSSAAQAPVRLDALRGKTPLNDKDAYAQSKLALTMWSRQLATSLPAPAPAIIAVNPGSLLGSKMVQQAYGIAGGDIQIGADILVRAALDDDFAEATGRYFDNDAGHFASPHRDALDNRKNYILVDAIRQILADIG